jgi:hypothetical protein
VSTATLQESRLRCREPIAIVLRVPEENPPAARVRPRRQARAIVEAGEDEWALCRFRSGKPGQFSQEKRIRQRVKLRPAVPLRFVTSRDRAITGPRAPSSFCNPNKVSFVQWIAVAFWVPTSVAHDDEASTGTSDSVGKCLSLPMHTDLVIRKSAVHFRDAVLWHVAGDTGGSLACTASDARVIEA